MNVVFVSIYSAIGRECANINGKFEATYCDIRSVNLYRTRIIGPTYFIGQNKIRIIRTVALWKGRRWGIVSTFISDGNRHQYEMKLTETACSQSDAQQWPSSYTWVTGFIRDCVLILAQSQWNPKRSCRGETHRKTFNGYVSNCVMTSFIQPWFRWLLGLHGTRAGSRRVQFRGSNQ